MKLTVLNVELLLNKNRVILALVVLSQYTRVTDRQMTKRQTVDKQHNMTIAELCNAIATFGYLNLQLIKHWRDILVTVGTVMKVNWRR